MQSYPPVSLICAPTDIGAGHRGALMGPEALRVAGLHQALASRGPDDVATLEPLYVRASDAVLPGEKKA